MAEDRRSTIKFPVVAEVKVADAPVAKSPEGPASSRPPHSIIPRHPSFIDPDWLDSETSVTRPPSRAAHRAAYRPAAPAPTTVTSVCRGSRAGTVDSPLAVSGALLATTA